MKKKSTGSPIIAVQFTRRLTAVVTLAAVLPEYIPARVQSQL